MLDENGQGSGFNKACLRAPSLQLPPLGLNPKWAPVARSVRVAAASACLPGSVWPPRMRCCPCARRRVSCTRAGSLKGAQGRRPQHQQARRHIWAAPCPPPTLTVHPLLSTPRAHGVAGDTPAEHGCRPLARCPRPTQVTSDPAPSGSGPRPPCESWNMSRTRLGPAGFRNPRSTGTRLYR
jgi:hypothetical protein